MDVVTLGIGTAVLVVLLAVLIVLLRQGRTVALSEQRERQLFDAVQQVRKDNEQTVQNSMRTLGEVLNSSQAQTAGIQDRRLSELSSGLSLRQDTLARSMAENWRGMDLRMAELSRSTLAQLETIRNTLEVRITAMQTDNQQQLEQMRQTVDEKLQKTLEERIGQSFRQVSERLEQVYKGLGEMQTLAIGVGDLKKVLSGVKTRGILGEIQLGAILEQILSSEQYEQNIVTKKGSGNPVEFAVKLPGDDMGAVYLPIDAKFPVDVYTQLLEAYDTADAVVVKDAQKNLERTIKSFAKSIRDKYIDPPYTTDFAVMFLPFEGLYAEVVRIGMVETLQRDYRINISGPTTMAAILNSLQMGFQTLTIQKHSSEVWNILGAVKTEFDKFAGVLELTKKQLENAHDRLENLVGVRTRQIQKKLRRVEQLPETQSRQMLELTDWDSEDEGDEKDDDVQL
jgi:DNA recombination protein RmuC